MGPQCKSNIITDKILNDSLCCSNYYNWCFSTCMGKLYIHLLTFRKYLTEKCIILPETFWIKVKADYYEIGPRSFKLNLTVHVCCITLPFHLHFCATVSVLRAVNLVFFLRILLFSLLFQRTRIEVINKQLSSLKNKNWKKANY